MKEKDFFGVVSAIAQFIEKADSEPDVGDGLARPASGEASLAPKENTNKPV